MNDNEDLIRRVRERLMHLPDVEEKFMFNGLTFMVNGKLCIGVKAGEILVRLDPELIDDLVDKDGWRPMVLGKKGMKGYIFVSEDVLNQNQELDFWISLALAFNPFAKASKKKIKFSAKN